PRTRRPARFARTSRTSAPRLASASKRSKSRTTNSLSGLGPRASGLGYQAPKPEARSLRPFPSCASVRPHALPVSPDAPPCAVAGDGAGARSAVARAWLCVGDREAERAALGGRLAGEQRIARAVRGGGARAQAQRAPVAEVRARAARRARAVRGGARGRALAE